MPDIPTISEAMQAIKTLERFIQGIGQVFGGGHPRATGYGNIVPQDVPQRWRDRVLTILRESGGQALRPMDITAEYMRRGWPMDGKDRRKISNMIRSTLTFAKRDGKVVVDGKGGYRLVA